jgi:hypothetical protein
LMIIVQFSLFWKIISQLPKANKSTKSIVVYVHHMNMERQLKENTKKNFHRLRKSRHEFAPCKKKDKTKRYMSKS